MLRHPVANAELFDDPDHVILVMAYALNRVQAEEFVAQLRICDEVEEKFDRIGIKDELCLTALPFPDEQWEKLGISDLPLYGVYLHRAGLPTDCVVCQDHAATHCFAGFGVCETCRENHIFDED